MAQKRSGGRRSGRRGPESAGRSGAGRSGRSSGPRTGGARASRGPGGGTPGAGTPRGDRQRSGAGRPYRASKETGLGGSQIEGRQAVRELLLAGRRRCREIHLSTDVDRDGIIGDIVELARELRVPVVEVPRSKLESMSRTDAPQGVVASAAPLKETLLEDMLDTDGAPFLLALDGVTDPGNLGAVLRTADCAGVTGVVLPRHRAVHVTPTVAKAAAGAIEYLPMALVGGLPSALHTMKSNGVWTVGLDMAGPSSIHSLDVADGPVCLVLGSEGRGLSRLVRERCDFIASIPLHGHLESLNVSAAGAIAMFEVARQRTAKSD